MNGRHAQITLQRARVLAPLIVVAQLMALLTSRDSGIPLTGGIVTINLIVMATGSIIAAALWLRRVPDGAANPIATFLLWSPMITSLCSFVVTEREQVLVLLLLEQVIGAAMINARWLVASYLVFDAAWIGAASRLEPERGKYAVLAMIVAQIFAFVLHRLMVHSLDEAEHQRIAAETRLAELERSEKARAELAEQLVHAQRLEAVGTLAAGLAHDMNNVLAAIMGLADTIAETEDGQVRLDAQDILHEAERGAKLTRNLLSFSRRGQYRREVVAVARMLDDTLALIRRTLPKTVELVCTGSGGETIEGDPAQLGQAIVNLCINASDAMTGRGKLEVAWDVVDIAAGSPLALAPARYARIRVTDTGSGMDEATRARVFEPFFTTKPQGKGTGLGLALVWGVVTKARGTVTVESTPGAGSTFTLYLPVSSRAAAPRLVVAPTARVAPGGGMVLVIDDEQAVRTATTRMLDELGLRCLAVDGGAEGLAAYERHRADIALVILDMAMPGMSGAEVFAQLRMRSDVPVLIATGYAVESEVQRLVEAGARVLEKPYRMAALQSELQRVLPVRSAA